MPSRALLFTSFPRVARLVAALILVLAAGAQAASAYVDPFSGDDPFVGRTDMGVDVCLTPGQAIRAVGSGVVIGIQRDWYAGQPYIWYQLTDGADAGRFVYVAEQIDHLARPGQQLAPGDVIARYAKSGSCIETGWSAASGATLAVTTSGYKEGQVTPAGVSFAHFLISVGVAGNYELVATKAQTARRRKSATSKPAPKPAPKPTSSGASSTKPAPPAATPVKPSPPKAVPGTPLPAVPAPGSPSVNSAASGGSSSRPSPTTGGSTSVAGTTPSPAGSGAAWWTPAAGYGPQPGGTVASGSSSVAASAPVTSGPSVAPSTVSSGGGGGSYGYPVGGSYGFPTAG